MPHSLRSYLLMVRWQALRLKVELPAMLIIQTLTGLGTIFGFTFLLPSIDNQSAAYFATGATSLILIIMGMVVVPQEVAQSKLQGTLEYIESLPVPRLVYFAADMTLWIAATAPGITIALVVASIRFDFALAPSLLAIPSLALVALTAASVGYTIAHLSPSPTLTALLSNIIIFGLFMFSPINFPAERLPGWLATVHEVLPVQHMAALVRGTLTDVIAVDVPRALTRTAVWCAATMALTYVIVRRRA